nr:hypothetical protein [Tanacetum cinerariifolium]
MTHPNPQRHVVPTTVLTKSKLVPLTAARPVTNAVLQPHVTRPRPAKAVVTKPHSPPRKTINRSPSAAASNFPPQVTAVKAPKVNVVKGNMSYLSDFEEINGGYVAFGRNPKGNMSYLSDFVEINGGYVAFGRNPKGRKISGKGKIRTGKLDFDDVYFVKEIKFNIFSVSQMCDKKNNVLFTDTECIVSSLEFKLPDENQVLLRVPRENNMYNVDLKNIVPSGDLTCLFANATLDETSSIGFMRPFGCLVTILNTLDPLGKFDEKDYEGFLVGYSNTDGDTTFEVKEPEFERRKPESEVHVSPSSSAKTKKHDDKTKREAKGKSPIELSTGYRNLSAEFKIFLITALMSAVGPSKTAVSPKRGESLYVDPSQYSDDLNMPDLEDITYSDDEEDVGAEADFSNLETTITVNLIPTTRVHKDHFVTQIIVRNKARLVAQRHTQEEGIDYEEVFAPVARIEAIWLFLAYASFMGFMVYQIDVKSAFLYGTIEEEALYGLHQTPRAWYETMANYLLKNGFQRGKIDQALFIKKQKGDILLVEVYVDDIIFGSTNKDFQDKYVAEILRKFGLTDGKSASTLIDTEKPLLKDPDGEDVDVHTYRSMIGSLMYLTSSRPYIMFAVCAFARFQVTPKASHLHALKRIFRYLKGKPHLGLWYPKDSPFILVAYSDSDYAGASLDRKSTTGGCQLFGYQSVSVKDSSNPLMADNLPKIVWYSTHHVALMKSWLVQKQTTLDASEGFNQIIDFLNASSIQYALTVNDVVRLQALTDRKKVIITEATGYEKPSTKLTFYKAFFLAQWKFLIHTILQCMSSKRTSWNEFSSSMASTVIYLLTGRKFNFSKYIFDSIVRNVDSSLKFYMYPRFLQLMIRAQVGDLSSHTTKYSSPSLTQKVFANMRRVGNGFSRVETPLFEGMLVSQQAAADVDDVVTDDDAANDKVGTAQRIESSADTIIDDQEDASKQGEIIANIDADEDVILKDVAIVTKEVEIKKDADVQRRPDDESEPAELKKVATIAKLMTKVVTVAATTPITAATITAAPSAAKRRKGVVIRDPEETVAPSIIIHAEPKSKDKGKGIMVEEPKPLKKKPQIKAQAKKNMIVYLKNMAGFKMDYFKGMSYDDIHLIFKKYFNSNVAFLEKSKEELEEEESRALKRKTESSEEKAVKK